ncbi:hypothetical protein EJD97_000797, partial [Solanum chilense]
ISRLITYLRSTFVNNDCYAQFAVKANLHEHILHASLYQQRLCCTFKDFEKLDLVSTFRGESGTTFPKVLGDDFESFARERSLLILTSKIPHFVSIRALLELLIRPRPIKLYPARLLSELLIKIWVHSS